MPSSTSRWQFSHRNRFVVGSRLVKREGASAPRVPTDRAAATFEFQQALLERVPILVRPTRVADALGMAAAVVVAVPAAAPRALADERQHEHMFGAAPAMHKMS